MVEPKGKKEKDTAGHDAHGGEGTRRKGDGKHRSGEARDEGIKNVAEPSGLHQEIQTSKKANMNKENSKQSNGSVSEKKSSGNGHQTRGRSTGSGQVSAEDIQMVQNLIEKCLQLYLTKEEVISVLREQASIDPEFTQLIWSKLEEQNPDFFRCYYTRLKLKAQIVMFNHLLEQQVAVVQKMQRGWLAGGNGSATASGIPLFQGRADEETAAHDIPGSNSRHNNDFEEDRNFESNQGRTATTDPAMYLYSAETVEPSPLGYHISSEYDFGGSGGLLTGSSPPDEKREGGIRRNISLSDFDLEGDMKE